MPIALADTKIHEGWHNYHSTFLIDEKITEIRIQPSNHNRIRVDVEQEGVIVDLNQCRSSPNYRACYLEQDYDQGDIGPQGALFPGVKVSIYKINNTQATHPNATFSYNLDYSIQKNISEFNIGDKVLITLNLENKGTGPINNIRAEFDINPALEIVDFTNDIRRAGRTLFHTGFLTPTNSRDMNFILKLNSFEEVTIPYKLYYDSPNRTLNEGEIKIKPETVNMDVYDFDVKLSKTNLNLEESTELTLSLKNLVEEEIQIKRLRIFVPSTFGFRNLQNLRNIRPGEFETTLSKTSLDRDFKISLTPKSTGDFKIRGFLELEYLGIPVREDFDFNIKVSSEGLKHSVSASKSNVVTGSRVEVVYTLENENPVTNFHDIQVNLSGLINQVHNISRLAPNTKFEIREQIMIQDEIKPINITTNKPLPNISVDFELIQEDFVIIQKNLLPDEVKPGNTTIVQVQIANNLDEAVFVNTREVFNKELELLVGRIQEQTSLMAKETKELYLYRLQVPDDYPYDVALIDTVVTIDRLNYTAIFGKDLIILGEEQIPFTGNLDYGLEEIKEEETIVAKGEGSINQDVQLDEEQKEETLPPNHEEEQEEEQTNPNLFERFFNWVRGII